MKTLSYQEAIDALNKLQSNADVLQISKKFPHESALRNVPNTIKYLARMGISLADLDQLKAIHVSGTKGKGSTCAFCESILRHHGFRTGFFSSPHIVAVRERIRIAGNPLSEAAFAHYFWEVYDTLRNTSENMPPYFKFLTIMAFYVFLKEKVDVAIIEVGIGGQYDCTNVLRQPYVCGISSLGLDHTSILGSTLPEIAWQKAGIMKSGTIAITAVQKDDAMKVLVDRATSIGAKLLLAPPLRSHDWKGKSITLGLSCEVQEINAALAVQLISTWLHKYNNLGEPNFQSLGEDEMVSFGPTVEITDQISEGLRNCQWLGRYQVLKSDDIIYYLDGAHTSESIKSCIKWYKNSITEKPRNKKCIRGLLFSITGDRTAESLLTPLINGNFDFVFFSPTILFTSNNEKVPADFVSISVSKEQSCQRCEIAKSVWLKLIAKKSINNDRFIDDCISIDKEEARSINKNQQLSKTFPSIGKALSYLHEKEFRQELQLNVGESLDCFDDEIEIDLLVTGSLHLVGGVLGILNPNINDNSKN
ncbi:hypothetical protein CHUAL_006135 [Chamberlinius hualienensis]